MLLSKLQCHMHRLHIHEISDLFHALVRHAGALCDQLLIVFHPGGPAVAADDQPVIRAALIWELNVKAIIPVIDLLVIDLAHIVPAGCHAFDLQRLFVLVQDLKFRFGLRCFSDDPSV